MSQFAVDAESLGTVSSVPVLTVVNLSNEN